MFFFFSPGISKKPIRRISDQSNRVSKSAGGVPLSKNLRMSTIKTTRGQSAHSNIADARNKIIQKQRQKLTDAREKLGQIAKQTDARLRLLKLRESQRGIIAGVRPTKARVLPEPPVLQRTVQSRINNPLYEEELMDYTNNVAYLNRNYPDRDIHAETYNYPFRARPNASVLFRTVENDLPHSRLFEQEQSYSWSTPIMPTIDEFADIPVSRINSRMSKGIGRSDDLRGSTPTWDVDDTPIVITKKIKPQETVGILKR